MSMVELPAVFLTGAALYGCIELLSRGWTHWSMLLAGGVCICVMYWLANNSRFRIWQKWVLCAAVITTVEFLSGAVFNMILGWHIWDYSNQPLNLLGQICPVYSLTWLGLSVPGEWLCRKLHGVLHQ